MNGIEELLSKYDTSLEDIRKLLPELLRATEAQQTAIEFPTEPKFLTADEAKEYGIELEADWVLKLTPDETAEAGFRVSYITPDNWEILPGEQYISPEGETFTPAEMEAQEAEWIEHQRIFGEVFGDEDIEAILGYADTQPEAFYQQIFEAGRSEDTEKLLRTLFPQITEEEIGQFFTPMTMAEQAKAVFGEVPWTAMPNWEDVQAAPWYLKPLAIMPLKLQAGLGVAGAYLEKYVERPWQLTILTQRLAWEGVTGRTDENTVATLEALGRMWEEKGWSSFFSEEFHYIFDEYRTKETIAEQFKRTPWLTPVEISEWMNPVWFIPIGGAAGVTARVVTKVPVLGKVAMRTAGAVQAAERGILYPVTKPIELTAKGIERAGVGIGESMAKKLINQSDHLVSLADLPASERLLEGVLVDNWMKRALQLAARVPPIRKGIQAGLGWRILINRQSLAVEDIVGRAVVLKSEFSRMGLNLRKQKVLELRSIEGNPVRLFGFDKKGYSGKMRERLLPQYKGLEEAGTVEHVFIHPEMYNFERLGRWLPDEEIWSSAKYVTCLQEINSEIFAMLKAEGVPPEHVIEDWIHRVVTGRITEQGKVAVRGRPGVAGVAVGAKRAYEKPRRFETMAKGIQEGFEYEPNIEVSVASYIEEAFKKVGDARAMKYLEPFGELASERLAQRFPEVVERAGLTKTELADAAKLHSLVNRANRGEKLPEQTLRAMETRFPDQGRRLRALVQEPVQAEKQLRELLTQNEKTIRGLEKQLAAAKKAAVPPEAAKVPPAPEKAVAFEARIIPDEEKLAQAFKVMEYDDRLAFRSTMESQFDDIQRMIGEQSEELAGIQEFLATDAVALYRGTRGKQQLGLTALLRHGEMPETLGLKQAEILLMGRPLKPGAFDKAGKVRWEYIIDELAEHFKMSEQQLVERIGKIAAYKAQAQDLKVLIGQADQRVTDIKRMLGVLDGVDVTPRYVPKAESGMPEAGLQQDMFGYELPYFPKGKATYSTMSMDDYNKLVAMRKEAGLPPPDVAVKPKIEGIKELHEETVIGRLFYDVPPIKTAIERNAGLEALRGEAKALMEARKAPFWQAKAERAFRMEQVRQPGIGEGYIMQPFAGGRIYKQEFIDAFNKFYGHEKGLPGLNVTSDIAGILRITKAALDFSAPAIQGLPSFGLAHAYMLTDPKIGVKLMGAWYKAFFVSIQSFFDPGTAARYVTKNQAVASQRIILGGSSRAVDYFATLEARRGLGGAAQRIMGAIPGKPYHRAETAFFIAGEIVRDEFYKILSPKAIAQGKEFELARFLDPLTGIGDATALGVPLSVRQLEQSFMWFAPNYTRACLTVGADIFRGGYTGAMARKALGGLIGAGAAYYAGIQYAVATLEGKSPDEAWDAVKEGFCIYEDPITGEVEWRPSGRFMTLKVDNYNFGVGGFWYGLVRLAGNIMGCIDEVGDKERIDLIRIMKWGSFNKKDNPFIYWWYSRSSPLLGVGFELATGRDFLGYPFETPMDYVKYVATRFEPIWAEQGINWMIPSMARDNEVPEGLARELLIPAELFGLRSFPEGTWTLFYDKANETLSRIPRDLFARHFTPDELETILQVQSEGKLKWEHLPKTLQTELLTMYPELQELYVKAQADSALRDSDIWKAWTGRQQEEQKIYYDRGNELIGRVRSGELDTRELREFWSDAGQNYGVALESLEKDPHYEEIYEYFASKEAEGDKYNWNINLALSAYQQVMFADYTDSRGDYNWDAKDKAIDEYIEKYGQRTYEIIRSMYADKKVLEGLDPALVRMAEDKDVLGREYWQLPFKPVYQMDEVDVPAEYYADWKQYQALATDAEQESFLKEHPDFARDWRAEWRAEHPQDDARLALWGYGGKLQSREAYDLVVKWSGELNIPLEQMGLGLPPQSLVTDYFGYQDIVRVSSGNSAEAKLYRLDNPEWDEWGQENWGWKAIDDEPEMLRLKVKLSGLIPDTPEYQKVNYQIKAYENEIPENLVDTYVDWYMTERTSFEDDWFLMENKEFYEAMVDLGIWQPKDFSKVPTRQVYNLYQTYLGLPKGAARLDFRAKHTELDAWLVLAFGYKPVSDRGSAEAPQTPWEEAQEAQRIKEWIEGL